MPDISLLEPAVLRGVIEKLVTPENMLLSSRLPKSPHPFPTAQWDVIKGSRQVARPNIPNSEAHIVAPLGRAQMAASFIYLREKKVFNPTTLYWLRAPGTVSNKQNAEQAVLREVTDLNQRFDNFLEWACWAALTGTLTLTGDVVASIDYQIPASHKIASPTTQWSTATAQQMVADVTAWKRLIQRDARVPAREAFATDKTVSRIFNAFATAGAALLSDRSRDAYYSTGTLPGFLQLDWNVTDSMYDDTSGTPTLFVPDDTLFITNLTDGRPMEILEGPTADDEAPDGYTGKFSKTWKEKDPSARQYLLEWNVLPVITRPEQIVVVADVSTT